MVYNYQTRRYFFKRREILKERPLIILHFEGVVGTVGKVNLHSNSDPPIHLRNGT
jgi:hypothetical protein